MKVLIVGDQSVRKNIKKLTDVTKALGLKRYTNINTEDLEVLKAITTFSRFDKVLALNNNASKNLNSVTIEHFTITSSNLKKCKVYLNL